MSSPRLSSVLHALLLVGLGLGFGCGPQVGEPNDSGVDAGFQDLGDDDDSGDDDGAVCSADPCSPLDQCGCAAGLACDLDESAFSEARGICRTATAGGTETTKCTADQECAVGFSCLGNQCRALCDANADCGTNVCAVKITYGPTNMMYVPGVQACSKTCRLDVVGAPGGCPESVDVGCRAFTDAGIRHSDCAAVKAGAVSGATCTSSADCARGFTCTGSNICRQTCAISVNGAAAPNSCPSGTAACTGYTTPYTLGDIVYGYCPG